jgi:hypothetical protein
MARLLISVSQSAVLQGELSIEGCTYCIPAAKLPFWKILDSFREYRVEHVQYILPVLAHCPRCRAPIDETTAVQPHRDSTALP